MVKVPPPLQFRKSKRGKRHVYTPPDPVVPFALASATYISGTSVTLVFNQPISIANISPETMLVSDGSGTGYVWVGYGAIKTGPNTVMIEVEQFESASAGPVLLTVNESNGIVSEVDETAWAGVTDLQLPYEE